MPNIPTYDIPEVESRPVGTPYEQSHATPEAFGAGVAQGIGQLGAGAEHVAKVAAEHYHQANAAQVMDGLGQLQDHINGIQAEVGRTQGENAAAVSGQANISINDKLNDLANNFLQNDEQRKLFQQHANKAVVAARSHIEEHVAVQNEVAKKEKFESLAKSQVDNVAVTGDVAGAVAMMRGPLEVEAARRGLPEEAAARFKDEYLQKLAIERAKSFIASGDGEAAQKFIESEMPGATRYDPVTGKARPGTVREVLGAAGESVIHQAQIAAIDQKAGARAQAIFGSAIDPKSQMVDEGLARKMLDAMPPGKLRDETLQRLDHRIQVAHTEHQRENDGAFSQALAAYEQNHTLAAVPPAVKARLLDPTNPGGPDLWHKLEQIAHADAAHARNQNQPTQTQVDQWNTAQVWMQDEAGNGRRIKPEDVYQRFPDLAPTQRKLIGEKAAHYNGIVEKGNLVGEGEWNSAIRGDAEKIFPANKTDREKFIADMANQRETWMKDHSNKAPTREEMQKIIAERLTIVDPGFWSANRPRFKTEGNYPVAAPEKQTLTKALGLDAKPPPAPADTRPRRTFNGETRAWDEASKKWVPI